MKVAIVGSRGYPDLDEVARYVRTLVDGTEIVSGGAAGVDTAAECQALKLGWPTKIFLPDWQLYGVSAGFRRNRQIVDYADAVVAFWDGASKGTASTIGLARRAGKLLSVNIKAGKED